MPVIILFSNWPAAPTNGSPWVSSSAPGASPTNMMSALMLPTPNTTFLPARTRAQQVLSARTISRSAAHRDALSPAGKVIVGAGPNDGATGAVAFTMGVGGLTAGAATADG